MIQRQLKIFLVRHGLDASDEMGRLTDGRLTLEGRSQSEKMASYLSDKGVTEIISSPLQRAKETSEIIADHLRLKININPNLRDRDLGQADGLTHKDVYRKFQKLLDGDRFHIDWKFPDGESNGDVFERADNFFRDLISRPAGKIERIVVVSHALVLNYLLYAIQDIGYRRGIFYQFKPGIIAVLENQGDYFQLQLFNLV